MSSQKRCAEHHRVFRNIIKKRRCGGVTKLRLFFFPIVLLAAMTSCAQPLSQEAKATAMPPAQRMLKRETPKPPLSTKLGADRRTSWYINHKVARQSMLARCDRLHGHLTVLQIPGSPPLECSAAVSAQALRYASNLSSLKVIEQRCKRRKDERELFSECQAAKLAEQP